MEQGALKVSLRDNPVLIGALGALPPKAAKPRAAQASIASD